MPHIDLAQNFFQAWNDRSLVGIVGWLAEDCVYHNMPMTPIRGRAAIEAYIGPVIERTTAIDWIVLAIAEDKDGRVLNERLDRLQINAGWLEIPIMGILEFTDGRISLWRDYFDLLDYQQQKKRLGMS